MIYTSGLPYYLQVSRLNASLSNMVTLLFFLYALNKQLLSFSTFKKSSTCTAEGKINSLCKNKLLRSFRTSFATYISSTKILLPTKSYYKGGYNVKGYDRLIYKSLR